jgi:hypothetical protein
MDAQTITALGTHDDGAPEVLGWATLSKHRSTA